MTKPSRTTPKLHTASAAKTGPKRRAPTILAPPPASPALKLPGGKLGVLIDLLQRDDGATLEAMMDATGWQKHSVRGAIAGALKKKAGLNILSEKTDTGRAYRIVDVAAASELAA